MLMYLFLGNRFAELLLLLVISVVEDYCYCHYIQPIWCCEYLRHAAAAQIAYKITCSRSIQVELGKVEGFQWNSESAPQNDLVNLTIHLNVKAHWLSMQHEPISLCQVV